jgi:hypothetical protein
MMIRRFIAAARSNSAESLKSGLSEDSNASPTARTLNPLRMPPSNAFSSSAETKLKTKDVPPERMKDLAPFDACVEACDALAASSTSSGRIEAMPGLVDCSVLVSPDGDILLIPQEQQKLQHNNDSVIVSPALPAFDISSLKELGKEYESAIFMGNDLVAAGDKALNGFSAKGWSIPAASLAIKQNEYAMEDMEDFLEDFILARTQSAMKESDVIEKLRFLAEAPGQGVYRFSQYQAYIKQTFPNHNLDVTPTRVGPLLSPGGTIQECAAAAVHYYATTAASDANRWRAATQPSGPLNKLKKAKFFAEQRAVNRQKALQETFKLSRDMEVHLTHCKTEAACRWDAVQDAEETVTRLVEEKMVERSRSREQQRLEQLKADEEIRAKDAANGNFGATSSEIWDIVSQVTASMDEGSFEPMDLPQPPLSVPRDKSHDSLDELTETNGTALAEEQWSMPSASRHYLEEACCLPELRTAAIAADEAVEDAARDLLKILSDWDTTNRSARIAAETCLLSACNAQATCFRSLIDIERASIEERMKNLKELEKVAENIDARADMNHYITLDKKERGGQSMMGDDDDGGVASALAVLNSHVDGSTGMVVSPNKMGAPVDDDDSDGDQNPATPEQLESAVEELFDDKPLLRADTPDNEESQKAREDFETKVELLCKTGSDMSSFTRSLRSTICYALNSKRSVRSEILTQIQFDGLCRVFTAVLSGCDVDRSSGVALAKMCMMLSQTFYISKSEGVDGSEDPNRSTAAVRHDTRTYVKSLLMDHALWKNENFWCV